MLPKSILTNYGSYAESVGTSDVYTSYAIDFTIHSSMIDCAADLLRKVNGINVHCICDTATGLNMYVHVLNMHIPTVHNTILLHIQKEKVLVESLRKTHPVSCDVLGVDVTHMLHTYAMTVKNKPYSAQVLLSMAIHKGTNSVGFRHKSNRHYVHVHVDGHTFSIHKDGEIVTDL